MAKVSVVVATYNYGHYVGDAIRSVLDQTWRDRELVVVDDGSTDNTREVVDGFGDASIGYVYQDNRGAPAAYNRGLELSDGEYVVFLDADDILLEYALEKLVHVLERHPQVGFSYGQASLMDADGHVYRVRKSSFLEESAVLDGKEQIRELLFVNPIMNSALMARRRCIEEVGGFREELRNFQDHHMWIMLAKRCPVAYIAEPLVKYRIHPAQIHGRVDPGMAERAFLLFLEEVFEDPRLARDFASLKDEAYSYSYRRIARYAYAGRDMRMARRYVRKAFLVYPRVAVGVAGVDMAFRYVTSLLPPGLWEALRGLKRRFQDPVKRIRD